MDKYLESMRNRLLENVSNEELETTYPKDLCKKYYVTRSTILRECEFRGIKHKSRRDKQRNINITLDDVMNNSYSTLAKQHGVSYPTMVKIVEQSLNIKSSELRKMKDEVRGKLYNPVNELTDDELKLPVSVLRKKYRFSQYDIQQEREKRSILIPTGGKRSNLVQQLTDDDLFNKSLAELVEITNSSIDTISRERRRRRKEKK